MKHIGLFEGIGGFSLAAQWMGWETVAWCEINQFCQNVLKYHFPQAYAIGNIFDLTVDNYGNLLYICDKEVITMGQPKSTKYDNAVNLYESGLSIGECAEFYEISRQAMHKILQRRECVFRSNLSFGEENHFHRGCMEDHSKKKRVQHLVEKAIKKSVLINPNECEKCHCPNTFKDGRSGIQAHHCDYDKPLEVMWLCQKCHHEWHITNKAINETDQEKSMEPSAAIDVLSGGFP
jgi:predicted DNA-binding protein YlxM (UPF0122 family)